MKALIVVAHGSRRHEANEALRALAEELAGHLPETRVRHAYLELAEPSLEQALEAAAQAGATEVTIHPFFLSLGTHTARDIPAAIERAKAGHPAIQFRQTDPLGQHPGIVQLVLAQIESSG
jgi:sirohydrochlorin cobaltochelatase